MKAQIIAVVPSQRQHVVVSNNEGRIEVFDSPSTMFTGLAKLSGALPELTVLGIMGGVGQELFVRLSDLGVQVVQLPFSQLESITGLQAKSSPQERALSLLRAWEERRDAFYPLQDLDSSIALVRELTRVRIGIQEYRKAATNELHQALKRIAWLLPKEAQLLVSLLSKNLKQLSKDSKLLALIEQELKRLDAEVLLTDSQQARLFTARTLFANPAFVSGTKAYEEELETRILRLAAPLPIWHVLHSSRSSPLPQILGLGPSLGGSLVGEIGSILRFPTAAALRAYARFHLNSDKEFPHRQRGQIASWNPHLNQAIWFWSTDQMARYEHPWKTLYLWKKARELQAHPETVPRQVRDKQNRIKTMYDYTLKHLDLRAKRWTGSQLLEYVWHVWQELASGRDPEEWYIASSWPSRFARAENELEGGLLAYLQGEIIKRRRSEPKSADQEEDEEDF